MIEENDDMSPSFFSRGTPAIIYTYIKNRYHAFHGLDTSIFKNTKKEKPRKRKITETSDFLFVDSDEKKSVPTIHDLRSRWFSIEEIKDHLRTYHLPVTGTKNVILMRLYIHTVIVEKLRVIKCWFRRHLCRKYAALHGPARFKRGICVNDSDIVSMDPLDEIPFDQFVSYTDETGKTYGFDILSVFNMIAKNRKKQTNNPYTRIPFPEPFLNNVYFLIKMTPVLFGYTLRIRHQDEMFPSPQAVDVSPDARIRNVVARINELGDYAEPSWVLNLSNADMQLFVYQLQMMWHYRLGISSGMKRRICSPFGNPFPSEPEEDVQQWVALIMENMVNRGIDDEHQKLGAQYVLACLTLVCPAAASSIPWLYDFARN